MIAVSIEYQNFLAHQGVKGQKWGLRRYQNDDGTLTELGKQRYGGMKDRGDEGLIKKWTLGSEGGGYAFAKWRERRHVKNLEKATKAHDQRKIDKYQSKLDAQRAANRNRDAYRRHSSTAKLVAQNVASLAAPAYRHARARGSSRIESIIEAGVPGVGTIISMYRDKKAYGKYIVWSGMDGESM